MTGPFIGGLGQRFGNSQLLNAAPVFLPVSVILTSADTSPWVMPLSWQPSVVIQCVGGAGGGSSTDATHTAAGGGGGEWAQKAATLVPGNSYAFVIGAAGSGSGTGTAGGDTTFNSTTCIAKGGLSPTRGGTNTADVGGAGGTGGTGDSTHAGGQGGSSVYSLSGGPGGGASGGPHGVGADGGATGGSPHGYLENGGGGGGGADGGTIGQIPAATLVGGTGGAAQDGTAGGAGGAGGASPTDGTAGAHGSGGGGGGATLTGTGSAGGAGGVGIAFDAFHGPGGGGGGGGYGLIGGHGGGGGGMGGGGGGGGYGSTGGIAGDGATGGILITGTSAQLSPGAVPIFNSGPGQRLVLNWTWPYATAQATNDALTPTVLAFGTLPGPTAPTTMSIIAGPNGTDKAGRITYPLLVSGQQGSQWATYPQVGALANPYLPAASKWHVGHFAYQLTAVAGELIRYKCSQLWEVSGSTDHGNHAQAAMVNNPGPPDFPADPPGFIGPTTKIYSDVQTGGNQYQAPWVESIKNQGWIDDIIAFKGHTQNAGVITLVGVQTAVVTFNASQTAVLANGDIIAGDASFSSANFQLTTALSAGGTVASVIRTVASPTKTFAGGWASLVQTSLYCTMSVSQAAEPTFVNGCMLAVDGSAVTPFYTSPMLVTSYNGSTSFTATKMFSDSIAVYPNKDVVPDTPGMIFSSILDGGFKEWWQFPYGSGTWVNISDVTAAGVSLGRCEQRDLGLVRPARGYTFFALGGDQTSPASQFFADYGPFTWSLWDTLP